MDTIPKYNVGDEVYLIQEINALGQVKDNFKVKMLKVWVVSNPCETTTMKRIDGEPVNFYVVLEEKEIENRRGGRLINQMYHQQNLVPINEFNPTKRYIGV